MENHVILALNTGTVPIAVPMNILMGTDANKREKNAEMFSITKTGTRTLHYLRFLRNYHVPTYRIRVTGTEDLLY